mmetsp:Transcript_3702/g.5528  ORF Transcript_3702/g.5528 Transcript_3702/m.5528 type:complete len:132 (+) Transcript_3702:791-1186(+)|eukprot:scaffold62564_cov35-Tisochrysis_lutea.AAC.3
MCLAHLARLPTRAACCCKLQLVLAPVDALGLPVVLLVRACDRGSAACGSRSGYLVSSHEWPVGVRDEPLAGEASRFRDVPLPAHHAYPGRNLLYYYVAHVKPSARIPGCCKAYSFHSRIGSGVEKMRERSQ